MSVDTLKQLVEAFYQDIVDKGDFAKLRSYVHADYLDHNAVEAGRGPNAVRRHMEAMRTTFPDLRINVEQILADGDCVVTRIVGQD